MIYEGHIRFEQASVVVVNLARDLLESIPLTNVFSVNLAAETVRPPSAALPEGPLPEPWKDLDVGSVAEAGQADFRSGGFRILSAGTNLFGSSDSFHFVFKPVQGDSHLICRVVEVEDSHPLTQAGLTIRESLSAGARQVSLMATARRGALFGRRAEADANVELLTQRAMRPPQWLKLSRHGHVFTSHCSRDGRRWTFMGRTHLVMPDEVLVGIGSVSIREGVLTRSRVDQVQEGKSPANGFVPEVRLVGGSMEVGSVESMDDSFIQFGAGGTPVATKTVANIRFRSISQRMARTVASGRTGVVLTHGEFVSGDVRALRNGYVTLSSVPLGLIHFDVGTEVAAVILRKPGLVERPLCRLTTSEGSVWMAATMTIEGEWVILKDTFGVRRVPLYKVVELEWREKAAA